MLLSLTGLADAATGEELVDSNEREVIVTTPTGYRVRRTLLFPFELPSYLMRAATIPLVVTGRFIEKHHLVERTIDLLSNEDRTLWVYPLLDVGAGSGFGIGAGLRHTDFLDRGYIIKVRYINFLSTDQVGSASFTNPHAGGIFGHQIGFKIKSSYHREGDEDFFGIGNDSLKENDTKYDFDDIAIAVTSYIDVGPYIRVGPSMALRVSEARASDSGDNPSVEEVFSPEELSGLESRIYHIDIGLTLSRDTRDRTVTPEQGGLQQFAFHHFEDLRSGDFSFNEYRIDLRQYIRLWKRRYVLALRNAWVFQNATGSDDIPFNRLTSLDVDAPLRSFDRRRFRDSSSVLFNVEYRYPVWDLIDGTVFLDAGRVFEGIENVSLDDIKYSVGGGIQFITGDFLLFRIQAAYGNDGSNVVFSASQSI